MYRKYKHSKSIDYLCKYKILRNTAVSMIRSSKQSFLSKLGSFMMVSDHQQSFTGTIFKTIEQILGYTCIKKIRENENSGGESSS